MRSVGAARYARPHGISLHFQSDGVFRGHTTRGRPFCYNKGTMTKAASVPSSAVAGSEARLKKLEEDVARLKAPALWLEVLKALAPLATGLAVAIVGYFLTGAVN